MSTLYARIADHYLQALQAGTLRAGDRFPSVRQLMRTHEVSLSTALQACRRLEEAGWLEARARSGYFVARPRRQALPPAAGPGTRAIDPAAYVGISAHVSAILARGQQQAVGVNLALAVAPPPMYPADALAGIMRRRLLQAPRLLTTMTRRHGNPLLRTALARRALERGITAAPEEIIVTQGCIEAVNLALRAVTQPGDTVAVESPTFYGLLQILEGLGLRAVELPTHPKDGLSVEALSFALDSDPSLRAVVVMPTLHNPLGCTMPDERKAALVALCAARGVPLIEDDIYGELLAQPPRTLKSFDTGGDVIHCGSLNKVLAPGLRLGWMLAGRWQARAEMLKYTLSRFPEELGQAAAAEFVASPAYERHLRRLRDTLRSHREAYADQVAAHFPAGTRLTLPDGGLLLWLQLPDGASGDALFTRALAHGIQIAPGSMFSTGRRYDHCIRLGCGRAPDEELLAALKRLGRMVDGPARGR
ncbi:aminotransferase-like domain-containing protein [Piscinibacter sakaiensis]|uniref:Transcriptional regulator, GntR family domain/aspartate aminotransferase n=1 Tax=Piscinibacter sakaiensis TaxID=1547922 RepID=A0A0K8P2D0_PISS1|nr:transcriptional regulator, GntR family domain/aspartate aminotransferase [Piscinibacter sakaiensis]